MTHFNVLNEFLSNVLRYLEHSRLRDEHVYLQGRMSEVYRELKEVKDELHQLRQDYIKLHSRNKYINHENDDLWAEINNLKSQITEQEDDADDESDKSDSNDNRPGKKRKVGRRQIDQSEDESETDEENARVR